MNRIIVMSDRGEVLVNLDHVTHVRRELGVGLAIYNDYANGIPILIVDKLEVERIWNILIT